MILRLQKLRQIKFSPNFVILKFAEIQKFLRLQFLGKFVLQPKIVILKLPENLCEMPVYRRICNYFQFILRLQKLGKIKLQPNFVILN